MDFIASIKLGSHVYIFINTYSMALVLLKSVLEEKEAMEANTILKVRKDYHARVRDLVQHLKHQPNVKNTIPLNEYIHWTPGTWRIGTEEETFWKDAIEQMYPVLEEVEIPVDDGLLQCPRCKLYKTDHYTKQTRGADEPETIFAKCFHCKYRWRQ
jgi:DNA-directed RNA polymerase subunit M/transcription elongation factor TFIIS